MKIWPIVLAVLGGCYLPAARDDFSGLGGDQFSNLIREAYSDKVSEGRNSVGIDRIDKVKANAIAQRLMLGKALNELGALFNREGGQCLPAVTNLDGQVMTCEVRRAWKLKNIGAEFPAGNWSEPALKMIFRIGVRKGNSNVDTVVLEVVDITKYSIGRRG
jgi:hypothetical protein